MVVFVIGPSAASVVETFREVPDVDVATTSLPPVIVAVVPTLKVPAVTAAAIADCRSAMVLLAPAV